ncbi:hypothetical protein [Halogeometricum borinquense]|uniref:hypothetical protein n=1 Tax=Halogeometricum borinquense TaxID=60847 RepID=UPI001F5C4C6A|nr:hypothetical protein [Halogeometricum borinquense]
MSDASNAAGQLWHRWGRFAAVVVITVVVALGLVAGGLWLYTDHLYRTSYESSYTYDVALNTNETLEDATFYLPLPVEADKPDLSAAMVETGTTVGDNFSYRVVETEYGRMLELSADRVTVTPRYYEFVEENGVGRRVEISASEYDPTDPNMTRDANAGTRLRVSVPVEESVSTAAPWGVEPMFTPRQDRRPAACGFPSGGSVRCSAYETKVYANYETNETTRVNVMTTVEGQNSWWVFGWSYDYYRDAISVELHGPHGGWTDATGTVEVDTDQRQPPSLLDA